MEENELIETEITETEIIEQIGVSEDNFNIRMDSLDNLLMVNIIALALIAGCLIATLVMRFFHHV